MNEEVINEQVTNEEVVQQLSDLVEVLQTEQELKAEEQAKVEEQEKEMQLKEEQNAEFQQALLTSLEEVDPGTQETILTETKEILLEIKAMKEQEMYMVPNEYWASNTIIIYACLIPLFLVVRWIGNMIRSF